MKISVDLGSMQNLIELLHKVRNEIQRIEEEFREIKSGLGEEIKRDLKVSVQINKAENVLGDISAGSARYSHLIQQILVEYQQLEKKILEMASKLPEHCLSYQHKHEPNNAKDSTRKGKRPETFWDRLIMIYRVDPCRLPKVGGFKKYPVKPGLIANGKNILIRTWTESYLDR